MIEFTQQELYEATSHYQENREQLISRAEASVVDWKYASHEMLGMFPLFDAIGFRGSNWWTHAERRWLQEQRSGEWYLHGLDAERNVRIIKAFNGIITVFVLGVEIVDEVRYGAAVPLTRSIMKDGRVQAAYEYSLYPHQYSLQQFEYAGNRCMRSVEQSWYVSDGKWVEATRTTTANLSTTSTGCGESIAIWAKALEAGPWFMFVRNQCRQAGQRRPNVVRSSPI